jgi:hypothetical protein
VKRLVFDDEVTYVPGVRIDVLAAEAGRTAISFLQGPAPHPARLDARSNRV